MILLYHSKPTKFFFKLWSRRVKYLMCCLIWPFYLFPDYKITHSLQDKYAGIKKKKEISYYNFILFKIGACICITQHIYVGNT